MRLLSSVQTRWEASVNRFGEGVVVGLGVATVVWMFTLMASADFKDDWWQKQCIEHGCAEYDRLTGEWQWKEVPSVLTEKSP